jgi:hypothetical protein
MGELNGDVSLDALEAGEVRTAKSYPRVPGCGAGRDFVGAARRTGRIAGTERSRSSVGATR